MKNSTYGIAYLIRNTSATLTEIRQMHPAQFQSLLEEVAFQESLQEYKMANYVANILAAIANTVPRKGGHTYKSSDFLGSKEPRRAVSGEPVTGSMEELEALAKKFNIKLPAKEIRDL